MKTNTCLWYCALMLACFSQQTIAACGAPGDGFVSPTPTADFIDHQDGTVTHRNTGLMWQKCALGQTYTDGSCNGEATTYTLSTALDLAANYTAAGYSDWRLPNAKELYSIVDDSCANPALNTAIFPVTGLGNAMVFFSSTPHDYADRTANLEDFTMIDFKDGSYGPGAYTSKVLVRLVRDLKPAFH